MSHTIGQDQTQHPKILSGIVVRDARLKMLAEKFKSITLTPELAIVQVGNRADSTAYIGAKMAFAKKVGVTAHHIHIVESDDQEKHTQSRIIEEIKKNNENPNVRGIIVQLPLPAHVDRDLVINSIDPRKDIDGLTSTNMMYLGEGRPDAIIPATARGVKELLDFYQISVTGKKVLVVGRSMLVGKPTAQVLANLGAHITVAHSKTEDLVKETLAADIIVIAVGKPHLIRATHVKAGQIIVDIGMNREEKLLGDVDFDEVSKIIGSNGAITPVPGGVGPMTVLCLFENLADACRS